MKAASHAPAPRGWYYGWTIVVATLLSQVAANGPTYNAFALFLRDLSQQLHAPISQLQLAVAGMVLLAAIISPFVGMLVDKVPARAIFAAALVLGAASDRFANRLPLAGLALVRVAGALVLAFAGSLPVVAVGCALIGFGGGLYTLLAAEFGADGFGRAYGLAMLFIAVISVAPFAIAKIQETSGSYAPGFLAVGSLIVVSGGLSVLLKERRGAPATTAKQALAREVTISPLL